MFDNQGPMTFDDIEVHKLHIWFETSNEDRVDKITSDSLTSIWSELSFYTM